ncbi:MAG: aldo/keto reductase, partial [Candidatus Marinimicrobia bacterium]|nr:aldo/keto reductase [Candidatus Neomarinimicrobiota bacterium]
LCQIHWPDPQEEMEEAWSTMADLVKEGKVRYIGVSNFSTGQMEILGAMHPIASLQPPYSMLRRDIEKSQIPYCGENGIGIVAYSPLQNGLLTGKFSLESIAALDDTDYRKSKNRNFQSPQVEINLACVEALRPIADKVDMTLSQLALAWALHRPEITSAITGTRMPMQIEETVKASGRPLDKTVMQDIDVLLESREADLASAAS